MAKNFMFHKSTVNTAFCDVFPNFFKISDQKNCFQILWDQAIEVLLQCSKRSHRSADSLIQVLSETKHSGNMVHDNRNTCINCVPSL